MPKRLFLHLILCNNTRAGHTCTDGGPHAARSLPRPDVMISTRELRLVRLLNEHRIAINYIEP